MIKTDVKYAPPNTILLTRQSNFELLRIFAMIMIIAHHFAVHGGLEYSSNTTLGAIYMWFLHSGGKIGVNIYFLISGYFLISEKRFKTEKIIKIWLQVFFYSVLFYGIMSIYKLTITHNFSFSIRELLSALFPISFEQWWFASTYFALYIFHPFINRFLNSLNQEYHVKLLVVMFILWSVISNFTVKNFQYSQLSWALFLYCFAGYYKLYIDNLYVKTKKVFSITITSFFVVFAAKIAIIALSNKISFLKMYSIRQFAENDLLLFLISIMVFISFKSIRFNSNFVNVIASSTFGVYLIHDNENIRQFLQNHAYARLPVDSTWLFPYSIFTIVAIFAVCSCIELIRKCFFEKNYSKLSKIISVKIEHLITIFNSKIYHIFNVNDQPQSN